MQSAKLNIKTVVDRYIKDFPDEFIAFKEHMKKRRSEVKDEKFATVVGEMRALFEMPETLHAMFVQNLTDEQLKWFKEGGQYGHEGAHWFATNFPSFRLPDKV